MSQIQLGIFSLEMYPFCALIGWVISYAYIVFNVKEKQLKRKVHKILELAIVLGILGARVLWVLVEMCMKSRLPKISDFVNGGLVFYGGMLIVIVYIYTVFQKIGMYEYRDIFITALPLFHGFSRIGCYFAGCCYGKDNIPVQLIEALSCFVIFMFLDAKRKCNSLKGKVCERYLFTYGIVRFFLEFLRGDEARGVWHGLSTSQYISVMVVVCVLFCSWKAKMNQKNYKDIEILHARGEKD